MNLPYSLAQRHQQLQCYWSVNDEEIALSGLSVGPGMWEGVIGISTDKMCFVCLYVLGRMIATDQLQEKLPFPVSSAYE